MLRPVLDYVQPETAKAAIALQQELRGRVSLQDDFGAVNLVAGVDVGFEDQGATARAAVVVLQYPQLEVVASAIARRPTTFPYVPGLLFFRDSRVAGCTCKTPTAPRYYFVRWQWLYSSAAHGDCLPPGNFARHADDRRRQKSLSR